MHIKRYGNLSRNWAVLNCILYLRYGSSSKIHTVKRYKLLQIKIFSYSFVKFSPKVPLLLHIVEKIERENVDFVLLSSFPSSITQKVYCVFELSGHQTNALLSEILIFLVTAAYELRSMSNDPKHASLWLSDIPFCL